MTEAITGLADSGLATLTMEPFLVDGRDLSGNLGLRFRAIVGARAHAAAGRRRLRRRSAEASAQAPGALIMTMSIEQAAIYAVSKAMTSRGPAAWSSMH
jgi:hypothetical protein